MTLSELKQQQQNVVAERERQIALKLQEDKKKSEEEMKRKKKEKKRLKKYQNKNKISFGDDEEIVEGLLLILETPNWLSTIGLLRIYHSGNRLGWEIISSKVTH